VKGHGWSQQGLAPLAISRWTGVIKSTGWLLQRAGSSGKLERLLLRDIHFHAQDRARFRRSAQGVITAALAIEERTG